MRGGRIQLKAALSLEDGGSPEPEESKFELDKSESSWSGDSDAPHAGGRISRGGNAQICKLDECAYQI